MRFKLFVFIAAFFVASILTASADISFAQKTSKSLISSVVIKVNGESIKENELLYFLIGRYGQDVLSELIENTILAGKAKEFGVDDKKFSPKDEMIAVYGKEKYDILAKSFDMQKIHESKRREYLATETYDLIVEKAKKDNKIEITDKQALDYFLKNIEDWSRPPMARFSIIVTKSNDEASKALAKINEGTSFEDAAKEFSIDKATKDRGGDIGSMVPKGYFRGPLKQIEDSIFTLQIDKVSDVINVDENYFIVKPTQRVPKVDKKFPEVKSYIVDILTAQKLEPIVKDMLANLRDESKIEIHYPIFDANDMDETNFTKVEKLALPSSKCLIYPTVVVVNGVAITEEEMLYDLLGKYGQVVLQELIENMVLYQQAKKLGVEVDPQEAVKILEQTYSAEKLQALEKSFNMDDVRKVISRELMARKGLVEKKNQLVKDLGIKVKPEDARKYFDSNKERWQIPERARFSIIVIENETNANKVMDEVKSGVSFADVARKYSVDKMTSEGGGDIGTLWPRGTFLGPFTKLEDKIFELKVGEVTEPIYIEDKFYVVKLTERGAREEKTFEDVKDSIIKMMEYAQVNPALMQWFDEIGQGMELDMVYPIFDLDDSLKELDASKKLQDSDN